MSQTAAPPTVVGRVTIAPGASTVANATLRVVARGTPGADEHAVPVAPDGSFSLWVAETGVTSIQLLNSDGEVLAEHPVRRTTGAVELEVGKDVDGARLPVTPTVTDPSAFASLRLRTERSIDAGELPARASAVLDRLESILGMLDDLLPDAHRALAGDESAAQRFRRGLLALPTIGVQPSAPVPAAPDRGEARRWAQFLIAGAATWIAADEDDVVELTTALASALDAILQLDLLASIPGDGTGTFRSMMMSMGGFDAGDFDGGGFGGDVPGVPNIPGRPKVGGGIGGVIGGVIGGPSIDFWGHRPKWHWDPKSKTIVWDPPLYVESCLERAIREMARLRANAPQWEVVSIDDAAACPGDVIVLTGSGFGSGGIVFFNATGIGTEVAGSTIFWSDTSISVRVPAGAHPGPIRLQISMKPVTFCGGVFPMTRLGHSQVDFLGGPPEIHYLDSDWKNGPIILPDTDAVIDLGYSGAAGVTASVTVWNGSKAIWSFGPLTGGTHQLTFHAPPSTSPLFLRVDAVVRNACGEVKRSLDLTVGIPPKLAIVGMEVIQAVQRPDPLTTGTGLGTSLRLAARKRTALRVYVTSGLPPTFSYETTPSAIALTGTARIGATAVAPRAAYTAAATANRLTALEFELPWALCSGTQPITVTVKPSSTAAGLSGFVATRAITTTFDPQSALLLLGMRVRDDHYGLPAPTIGDWNTSAQGARERYPIAEDGIVVYTAPGWEEFGTDRDLNAKDGWEDLLDDIDDIADDFNDIGQVWTAIVPNSGAYALNGIAHAPFDRIWPLDDDYRAMLARATNKASCAHEIAHTFGIAHSPGGGADDPDMSLPPILEPDVIGWRADDDKTFPPGWADLMSYSTPVGGSYQDRWPSAELWNRLFDRLN